jgi:uncharacterized protein (TIGR00369 family)
MNALDETPRITIAQFNELLSSFSIMSVWPMELLSLGWGTCRMRVPFQHNQVRPGGTLSGPTMMTLADTALYAIVLSRIGLQPLTVTSDLSIRFLRKPAQCALIADAEILRLGKKLAVGEVRITSEGDSRLVAHATGTYAIP